MEVTFTKIRTDPVSAVTEGECSVPYSTDGM